MPENEYSEDEGEAIQHWHEDGVEIDPLPSHMHENMLDISGADSTIREEEPGPEAHISNLSPVDAQLFYTNGELTL